MKKFGKAKFINKFTNVTNNDDTNTDFLNTIMNAINEGNKNTQNSSPQTVNTLQTNNEQSTPPPMQQPEPLIQSQPTPPPQPQPIPPLQPQPKIQKAQQTNLNNKPNNIFFNLPLYPTHNLDNKKDD